MGKCLKCLIMYPLNIVKVINVSSAYCCICGECVVVQKKFVITNQMVTVWMTNLVNGGVVKTGRKRENLGREWRAK